MKTLRIESALSRYNEQAPKEARLTKGEFADQVIPDNVNPNRKQQLARKRQLLSRWINGKQLTSITPEIIVKICTVTKCDPNFLFDWN